MRQIWALGLLAATLAAAPGAVRAEQSEVTIDNFTFSPPQITVPVGATVTWTNRDDIPHGIALGGKIAKSPPLDTGDAFSHTFDHAGTYSYFCYLHPKMQGMVIVK